MDVRGNHETGRGKEKDVKQTERNENGRQVGVGGGDKNVSFCFFFF